MKTEQAFFALAKAIRDAPTAPICQETDPDLWYPEVRGVSTETNLAKKLCQRCPVIKECLQYALVNEEMFGVWGGMTVQERLKLKGRGRGSGHKRGRPRSVQTV